MSETDARILYYFFLLGCFLSEMTDSCRVKQIGTESEAWPPVSHDEPGCWWRFLTLQSLERRTLEGFA